MTEENAGSAKKLEAVFKEAGISLSPETAERFCQYYRLLVERNRVMNLTAITEETDVFVKHFLDSAMLWKLLDEAGVPLPAAPSVVDVGTGAGFPGIPLKLLRPECPLLLLDALSKRVNFLTEVKELLSLQGVQVLHGRSEDAARAGEPLREAFDLAVSRAVSALPVLSEYCLPFVKVGGLFAAYKAGEAEEEIKTAGHAISTLGGNIERVLSYFVPGTNLSRTIILVRKTCQTPAAYPRKAGKPEKKPL